MSALLVLLMLTQMEVVVNSRRQNIRQRLPVDDMPEPGGPPTILGPLGVADPLPIADPVPSVCKVRSDEGRASAGPTSPLVTSDSMTDEGVPSGSYAVARCDLSIFAEVADQDWRLNIVAEGMPTEEPVKELPLSCNNGVLSTSDGTFFEALRCARYCGPPSHPHGTLSDVESALDHPLAALYLEGGSNKITCQDGHVLSGPTPSVCNNDGTWKSLGLDEGPMQCLRTCDKIYAVQRRVGAGGMIQLERSSENKEQLNRPDLKDVPVAGDSLRISCFLTHKLGDMGRSVSDEEIVTTVCQPDGTFDTHLPRCIQKCNAPVRGENLVATVTRTDLKKQKSSMDLTQRADPVGVPWVKGMDILEGDIVKYSCKGKSRLSGFAEATCDDGSNYEVSREPGKGAPECVGFCEIPAMPPNSGLAMVGSTSVSDKLEMSASDNEVVEGTQLQYSCKSGCVQVGGTPVKALLASITCKKNSEFDQPPPRCRCDLKMQISRIQFTFADEAQKAKGIKANQVKLKLYPLRKLGNDTLGDYDPKGAAKISMDIAPIPADFAIKPTVLTLNHDLNTYFLHAELCTSTITNLMLKGSRCTSVARSEQPLSLSDIVKADNARHDALDPDWEDEDGDWEDEGFINNKLFSEDSDTRAISGHVPGGEDCPLCVGVMARQYHRAKKIPGTESISVIVPMLEVGADEATTETQFGNVHVTMKVLDE